jgi:Tfp pilus assembly ATPase PilU
MVALNKSSVLPVMSLVPHIKNPQKSDHETPAVTENGMVWKSPSRAIFIGSTGSGKTNAMLAAIGHQARWRPWKHIFLMSANVESAVKGEYGILELSGFSTSTQRPWQCAPGLSRYGQL